MTSKTLFSQDSKLKELLLQHGKTLTTVALRDLKCYYAS